MGTIRIVLRTELKDKQGKSPIRIVYSSNGKRQYLKTNLKLLPANWDTPDTRAAKEILPELEIKKQQAFYVGKKDAKKAFPNLDYALFLSEKEVDDINTDLAVIKKSITDLEKRFSDDGIEFTSAMVIEKIKNKRYPAKPKNLPKEQVFDFIEKYLEDYKATRLDGSLQVYRSLKMHLKKYQEVRNRIITFNDLDYIFFTDFKNFMVQREDKKLLNTTITKQLSTLKTFIGYAKRQGIKISDSYKDFKIKNDDLDVLPLHENEFIALLNFDFSFNSSYAQARDVFVFSCVTGLRYSDMFNLKWVNIKGDVIKINVKKTKRELVIPITKYSREILSRYKDREKPLPIISNSKLNVTVKEICKRAGIVEPVERTRYRGAKAVVKTEPKWKFIGCHTGRKTFATLSLEKGMSIAQVMAIGGWTDYKSFARYVKVTEQNKTAVMVKAWGEGETTNNLKAVS